MTKEQKKGMNLMLLLTSLLVSNVLLRYYGLDYSFRFLTGIDFTLYALALLFFIFALVLLISDMDLKTQLIRSAIVIILVLVPIFVGLYEAKDVTIIERSGYTVYIATDTYQNKSIDEIYLKKNFIVCKYIDHRLINEEYYTDYLIVGDQLVVFENDQIVEIYDLNGNSLD